MRDSIVRHRGSGVYTVTTAVWIRGGGNLPSKWRRRRCRYSYTVNSIPSRLAPASASPR